MAENLCSKCRKIPRPRYFTRNSNFPSQHIGTREQIRKNKASCSFCRLVSHALFDGPVRYPGTDKWKVGVIWDGTYYYFSTGFNEPDVRIGVIQEENQPLSPANYARAITDPRVSFSLIQSWLDLCEQHHQQGSELQQTLGEPAPSVIPGRLIDVHDACVVPTSGHREPPKYVTLSYVWGEATQYELTTGTKSQLLTSGFLDAVADRIPKTIRDAMAVVRKLGIRYLWVDALCIIQDDPQDKAKEIHRMDSIYEGSTFTLVAASGSHADAGLSAASRRKGHQVVETIWPGVRMTAIHSLTDLIDNLKYGTRGWTFQEQILSSRILAFTDEIVYFRCHDCVWSENSRADATPDVSTSMGGPRSPDTIDLVSNPWQLYSEYLEKYSVRQLTKEEDIVNAMTGILLRISRKLECSLVYGLPTDSFEWGLLFSPTDYDRRAGFPSYSWAGWKGQVLCPWPEPDDFASESSESSDEDSFDVDRLTLQARETAAKNSWIVWYERPPQGAARLLCERDADPGRQREIKTRKHDLFKRRARMERSAMETRPTATLGHLRLPEYSVLQFWTVSLRLQIQEFPVPSAHRADIVNNKGNVCGQVKLPKGLRPAYGTSADFILLLSTNVTEAMVENPQRWDKVDSAGAIQMARGEPLELYKVMWIESHEGVSERVAVGEIEQRALRYAVGSKPVWKEIILK